jgi:hypothetical protein
VTPVRDASLGDVRGAVCNWQLMHEYSYASCQLQFECNRELVKVP